MHDKNKKRGISRRSDVIIEGRKTMKNVIKHP
jgi:hypothetical protein